MSELEKIRKFTGTAVIVDDGFLPVPLEGITAEAWAELRDNDDPERWAPIRETHFPKFERAVDLKWEGTAIQSAWKLYAGSPSEYAVLDPIFAPILATRGIKTYPLTELISFLEKEMQLDVKKHPDIASAEEDIRTSKLLFLDFYLVGGKTAKDMIANAESFRDVFASPVKEGANDEGRFVFLISTALPGPTELEEFRTATQVKSAFFKAIAKLDLTRDWLLRELALKVDRYRDMRALSVYVDTFSEQIQQVADRLRGELDQIELHDLTILNSARLEKDSEDLGEYLSWILSEALAARIRESAPLLNAAEGVDKIGGTPFEGSLMPKKVLFDLFSEITFAPAPHITKVRFGDVYQCVPAAAQPEPLAPKPEVAAQGADESDVAKTSMAEGSVNNGVDSTVAAESSAAILPTSVTPQQDEVATPAVSSPTVAAGKAPPSQLANEERADLVLVIAPGCDLQRCENSFDVLCVRGKITQKVRDLHQLLHQTLFGKEADVFRHLLRQSGTGGASYSTVEWYPKKARTIPRNELVDMTRYVRIARLNEFFGQEVKEEALRQFGRVGTPVDPSYSTPLSATVKLKNSKKTFRIEEAPDNKFVAAISTSGNNQNQVRITLSDPFVAYLRNIIAGIQSVAEPPLTEKVLTSLEVVMSTGSRGIFLGSKNQKDYDGGLRLRLAPSFEKRDPSEVNVIVLYPRRESDVGSDPVPNTNGEAEVHRVANPPDADETVPQATASLGTRTGLS